jgi:hypothetical protein
MSSPSFNPIPNVPRNTAPVRPANPQLAYAQALLRAALHDDGPRTEAARNAPRCRHVRSKGYRCGSPALRGKQFCFYHDRVRNRRFEDGLPALDDANSIQLAVMQVLDGLHRGKLEPETARVYLYGLRVAAGLSDSVVVADPDRVVLEDPETELVAQPPSAAAHNVRPQTKKSPANGQTKVPALAASVAAVGD